MDAVEAVARHHLKCWPEPFQAMLDGHKTAEFRLNDRNFQVGDVLLIREWCPDAKAYTHREIERTVTHVLQDSYGVPKGYAMLSLNVAQAALAAYRPFIAAECAKDIEFNIAVGIRRRKETVKLPELLRLINGGAAIASIEATAIKETIR